MRQLLLFLTLTTITVAASVSRPPAESQEADFPADYRQWRHVKSAIIAPDHPVFGATSSGVHHIYANALAMRGYETGVFPPGATIVADFLALDEAEHVASEGPRKRIDVMQRQAQRFAATDGWGYASFSAVGAQFRVTQEVASACHACHLQAQARGFVFSEYRP